MKTVKRLAAAIALTFALAFAAFADCQPPAPGAVDAPPCPGAQTTTDDLIVSETSESSASSSIVVEISETTIDVLLSALSIF